MFKQRWFWSLFAAISVVSLLVSIVAPPRLHIGLGWWMLGAYPVAVAAIVIGVVVTEPRYSPMRILAESPLALIYGFVIAPYVGLLASPVYFALTGSALSSALLFVLSFVTCRYLHGKPIAPII